MKYLASLAIAVSILLFAPSVYACSCANTGSFVQMAKRSELVARAKVIAYRWHSTDTARKYRPLAMILEIKEVYKGAVRSAKITVWGDNGMQCRPYVIQFPIGTEWVFALSKDSEKATKGEWVISGCGEYWLAVKGENVTGKITEGNPARKDSPIKPKTMSLLNLRKILKAP
jgi:hypothetical protein